MKNFKCNDCEELFDGSEIGSMLFCPRCGGHIEEESYQEPVKINKYNEYHNQKESNFQKKENKEGSHFIFFCIFCDKSLRIAFPFYSPTFGCPNCNNKYNILSTNDKIGVYLVVPKIKQHSSFNAPPNEPTLSPEEKKALYLFGLYESASLADLKIAYRKAIAEYHPDKVSHLGADLKKLAEKRTKEYNSAFDVLKKYFDQQS